MATPEGSRVSTVKHQASHGFNRGQPVVLVAGKYVLASTSTGFDGVVGTIADINRFELVVGGELDGLANISPGTTYYLSNVPGQVSTNGTRPVFRASDEKRAWIAGSSTAVSESATSIAAAIAAHVSAADPHTQYAKNTDLNSYIPYSAASEVGLTVLGAETQRTARAALQEEPTDVALVYTGDQLTTYSDSYGTKTFAYDGNGRMIGWTGTGKYRSVTLTYSGDLLTSKTFA